MKTHDKIQLASEMLLTAAQDYKNAKSEIDYVKCILLAGAVINVTYPLVKEFGGKTKAAETAAPKAPKAPAGLAAKPKAARTTTAASLH